jgi:GTPase
MKKATRAGFVAILGAPNAGKSTLLNRLIGQKISIVSPKPQTTRMRVLGVLTEGQTQIAFVDTPGIFAPKRKLDRAMINAAWQSLEGADAVVLLVDAGAKQPDAMTEAIVNELKAKFGCMDPPPAKSKDLLRKPKILQPPPQGGRTPNVILALNKTDAIRVEKLLPLAEKLNESGIIRDTFMISALTGDGVEDLKKYLIAKMPKAPWFFGEDQMSDLPSSLLAAEATREQLFRQLQQELPYGATVVPESWETKKDGSAVIRQSIVIARAAHKPIVLGASGARIKQIGQAARREIEQMLGIKAHLFLEVKVDEKWQDRPEFYKMCGLEFEN